MSLVRYFLLTPFIFSSFADPVPLFHPPNDWEFALPQHHSSFVQVGFLGKGSTAFRPSMNLATEVIDTSAREYLKAVKEIHLANPSTKWRDLGKFVTLAGEGRLTEITTISPAGEVKMLQMILVKGKMAYILTGAAIKADYLAIQKTFIKAFESFSLPTDLFSSLSQEEASPMKQFFENLASQSSPPSKEEATLQWEEFQHLAENYSEKMGKYWQFLILKDGLQKFNLIQHEEE